MLEAMVKSINMKIIFALSVFLLSWVTTMAQFDNPSNNSVNFENTTKDEVSHKGLELPAIKKPRLSNTENTFYPKKNSNLGELEAQDFNMREDDGLLVHKTEKAPKYFTKDKEIKDEYGVDQYLGDFKTKAVYVNVVYRDHEYVDGDIIRVFVNDDIVQSQITLDSHFRGFDLTLQPGFNKIDFQALNQGDSGPNTAELHVYDDNGVLVSAHEWNLLTGKKATVIIVKE
jgi:hypothetical protein